MAQKSNKMRDLQNLKSTLSSKYIGTDSASTNNTIFNDSEDSGRTTRNRRSNMLSSSAEQIPTDNMDGAEKNLTATMAPATTVTAAVAVAAVDSKKSTANKEEALSICSGEIDSLIEDSFNKTPSLTENDSSIGNGNSCDGDADDVESRIVRKQARRVKNRKKKSEMKITPLTSTSKLEKSIETEKKVVLDSTNKKIMPSWRLASDIDGEIRKSEEERNIISQQENAINEDNINSKKKSNASVVVDKKQKVEKIGKKAVQKSKSSGNLSSNDKDESTNKSMVDEKSKNEKKFVVSNKKFSKIKKNSTDFKTSTNLLDVRGVDNLSSSVVLGYDNDNNNDDDNKQHIVTIDHEHDNKLQQQLTSTNDITNKDENVIVSVSDPSSTFTSITPTIKSDPEIALISPSVSLDSANGSSINAIEINWPTYQTGYLFWGKLYSYCYWPCIVCPDPANQIVGNAPTQLRKVQPIHQLPPIQVHVRFFADNGRRNWVRQEHLIPYLGLEAFEAVREDIRIKFGMKSPKFRDMVPKKTRIDVWHQAIKEADIVGELPCAERLEKFFEIYENSVSLQKRQRRTSMLTVGETTSDIGSSIYGSTDKLNAKNANVNDNNRLLIPTKRERSESPFSPAFSPIKGADSKPKRRKISSIDEANSNLINDDGHPLLNDKNGGINLSDVSPYINLQESHLHSNSEYLKLFFCMKDFIIRGEDSNEQMDRCILSVTNNIWALSELNIRQKKVSQKHPTARIGEEKEKLMADGSLKRLSTRLQNINIRRSQTPIIIPNSVVNTTNKSSDLRSQVTQLNAMKAKSTKNRPIEEVVDDILNLEPKYLFRGMTREPVCKYCYKPSNDLKRCSNGCNTWLHVNCKINPPAASTSARGKMSKNAIAVAIKVEPKNEDENIKNDTTNNVDTAPLTVLTANRKDKSKHLSVPNIHITAEGGSLVDAAESFMCNECENNTPDTCCICHLSNVNQATPPNSPRKSSPTKLPNDTKLLNCHISLCTNKIHPICCQYWPQVSLNKSTVRCPSHVCHTCVSDDPKKFQQLGNAKLIRCVKCPATYHMDSMCIPAGSQILTASHIICPRHYNKSKTESHINVTWCFMCVKGGELLCCETCPIAVHSQCRNIPMKPSEKYICEECESGRFPLYGEIVWAKFNNYRWWPAIIIPPPEIPENLLRKSHGPLDFIVRFFGTHDHAWIPRRRVYRYIEGDEHSDIPRSKSQMDQNFVNGVAEASRFLRIIKSRRKEQTIATAKSNKLCPQPYVKIKANKAVPPVKLHIDLDNVSVCNCDNNMENPCGADSECLNRVLFNECNPKLCLAGSKCQNQMFESRISPRLEVVYMNERGFGLVCREPIKEGTFVIEYVGEIINHTEFLQRMSQKTRDRDENFYFLSVEKDYIIDAGPKGNLARFLNHSCEPNCVTQKWLVNGINRIGLFAMKDIPENTELTFNYFWDDILNKQKKICHCGAAKCSGEIGGKYKETTPKESVSETRSSSSSARNKKNKTASSKNKKFKDLKRLKPKLKIDLKAKNKTTRAKKHISADDM